MLKFCIFILVYFLHNTCWAFLFNQNNCKEYPLLNIKEPKPFKIDRLHKNKAGKYICYDKILSLPKNKNIRPWIARFHILILNTRLKNYKWKMVVGGAQKSNKNYSKKTSEFLIKNNLIFAINGGHFRSNKTYYKPGKVVVFSPWSDGEKNYGPKIVNYRKKPFTGYLINYKDNYIFKIGNKPFKGTYISNYPSLSYSGKSFRIGNPKLFNPLSLIGLNNKADKLFLVVIEDLNNKLPRRGIDVINATNTLLKFGMDNIILLDGGGSSILLVNINGKAKRLNTPSGNKFGNFIGKERYVGNYVGFDFVKKN